MGLFRKKDDAFANKVIKVLSTNDEAKFHQALLELGTIVQNKDSIDENRKLDIYDIICIRRDIYEKITCNFD